MRLLQFNSNGKVILTKDFSDNIPTFAILSHTWGVDGSEVTFKDIYDGHGQDKAGYDKIKFCGEQAKRDGLQYFWVDTCCIDKSSSAELAEAINSMFKWYRDAAKCYVYLSDVSRYPFNAISRSNSLPWESEFRRSQWFTRGWTLQELIAPRIVEFFSKEHSLLGDRNSLEQIVHDITRIPLEALRGHRPLQDFSVDERMSWSLGRNTTRQEDAAYCLWGIFDVHMPLIYGEGQKKAMLRLRKEIKEMQNASSVRSGDVHADSLVGSENWRLKTFTSSFNDAPVDLLSIHFVGREREIDLIRNAHEVCEENVPNRCAIWGLPGVGKTQLAIRYTKIFLDDPRLSAVFWMTCSNVEKTYQGFSKLLNLTDHPDRFKLDQNERVVAARRWLEQPEVSGIFRWLLVLDNVDITTLDFLRENLPRQGRQGRIILTTRTEAIAHAVCRTSGKLQLYFELKPPVVNEAVMLFFKSVGVSEDSVSIDKRNQVTDLMGCLGCLPFAVDHAASFMTQSSQTIEDLTRLYQGQQKSLIFDWKNLFSAYEVKSISGMFASQLQDLRRSNPEAYGLLNILVFWDPDNIEFEEIKTGALFLGNSSEPTGEIFRKDQIWEWTQWLVSGLNRVLYFGFGFSNNSPAVDTSHLESVQKALPSTELEVLIKTMSSEVQLQSVLQQLQMLSLIKQRSLVGRGAYSMHDLTQTSVRVALESNGTHLQWFRCAVVMACGAFRQIQNPGLPENWHRCEGLVSHILSLTEYSESVGDKNTDLLRARGKIAAYWCQRGRFHEARETYQQLIDAGKHVFHDADTEMIQWKLGLADTDWHLSNHRESATLYEDMLRLQEPQLGADHPDVLNIKQNLALVYRSQAQYVEARSMLEHILESRKMSLGPDHLDTVQAIETLASTINEYAEAEDNKAQYAEAERLHQQVLAYREAQLGTDHLDTLWTADNLGTNYRAQGRHLEAVEIYERVLKGRTLQLGKDHPQVLYTVANLASAYTSLGRLDEAETMYKRAITGNEQRLGRNHTQTLWVVEGLADGYHQRSRLEQAASLYRRALQGLQDRLGAGHPNAMRVMHKLANLYRKQEHFAQSTVLFEELLKLRKSGQRSANPELLRTYSDAAASYIDAGDYVKAVECYKLELAGSVEEYGNLHTETKKREQNLTDFLKNRQLQGDMVKGSQKASETISSEEPPSTRQSLGQGEADRPGDNT